MKENKNMTAPILITGCARSGTSMIAGVINMCGAFGGKMSGPNHNNQRGMFENARIRNTIVKPYLRRIKVDPMGQYPLPNVDDLMIPSDLKEEVEQVLLAEGYKEGPWMYKGAKMCLMWPAWHYAFPNAKWIIVRRNTDDIVRSCLRTGFMRAFIREENQWMVKAKSEEEGWKWWVKQHEKRFVEMVTEGLQCMQIWPHRMVDGDYTQIHEMLDWLRLPYKSEILDFVDPKLWHVRHKEGKIT